MKSDESSNNNGIAPNDTSEQFNRNRYEPRTFPYAADSLIPPFYYDGHRVNMEQNPVWALNQNQPRYPPYTPYYPEYAVPPRHPSAQNVGGCPDDYNNIALNKNTFLANFNDSINKLLVVSQFCYSIATLGQYATRSILGIVDSVKSISAMVHENKLSIVKIINAVKHSIRSLYLKGICNVTNTCENLEHSGDDSRLPDKILQGVKSQMRNLLLACAPWILIVLITKYAYKLSLSTPSPAEKVQEIVFGRVLNDFTAFLDGQLSLKTGELIAILEMPKQGTEGYNSIWWKGRNEKGEEGLFPSTKVEILKKRVQYG